MPFFKCSASKAKPKNGDKIHNRSEESDDRVGEKFVRG